MAPEEIHRKIESLAETSGRFRPEAFFFVLRALEHCRRRLRREGHVSGRELAESARILAIAEYGPTAKLVLNHWGIDSTEAIGRIVFLMVEHELLSKTDEDRIEDFRDVFDFEVEFVEKYRW